MDFGRRDVDRGHLFHGFGIAPFPLSEAFYRKLGTSFRIVLGAQELGEFFIRRKHVLVNGLGDLVGQAFLVLLGKFRRKFLGWFEERVRGVVDVVLVGVLCETVRWG